MSTDEKCYISHSGDAVYWLGQKHDETHDNKIVSCLVVYNNLTTFDFETQKEKRQAAEKDNAYQVYDLRALKTERNENNKEEWPRMTMPKRPTGPQAQSGDALEDPEAEEEVELLPDLLGSSLINNNKMLVCKKIRI
jgi:hypothetical protein